MRLAILMTNTDESEFAQRHPKDGEKFTQLMHSVRPDWSLNSYTVKDGDFPNDISVFDGIMITGSPASVNDKAAWVERLLELIKDAYAKGIPMFGACYGHQAIALALGGTVTFNPQGWVFGLAQSSIVARPDWMRDLPAQFAQYAAHNEAVITLPPMAKVLSTSDDCAITGFQIGTSVYTTQNHPEMTPEFIAALVAEYAAKLPPDVAQKAKASLSEKADTLPYAETIARFFEVASAD